MLARTILYSQAPRLIARRASVVPVFTAAPRTALQSTRGLRRSYATDPSEAASAGIKEKIDEVVQGSKTLKDFASDLRVVETTKKLKDLLEAKGYGIANPPGKLAMLGLVADSEFRAIFGEMRSLAAEHNISDADIMRFGQIGMEAKSTVNDAVEKAEEVKDEVVDTARNAEAALGDKVKSKL